MVEKIYDKIVSFYLISIVLLMFLCSILYSYFVLTMDVVSYCVIAMGAIGVVLYVVDFLIKKDVRIWNIFVLLIILLAFISYYYAFNKRVALWGYINHREGLLVIISYYIIFLVATTIENKNVKDLIVKMLISFGIVNVLYGILQVLDCHYIGKIPVTRKYNFASGLYFNADFMGTFMILMFGLCLPKFFFEKDRFDIKNYILLGISMLGVLLCGTMSSFLTMILLLIILIIYFFMNRTKKVKKFVINIISIVILFVGLYGLVTKFTKSNLVSDVNSMIYETTSVLSGQREDYFGTGRMYIWSEAFKYYGDFIYTGIGIDNFGYLGYKHKTLIYDSPNRDNVVYNAHNEYIQIITTEGIFMIFVYLLLMISIFIKSLNKVLFKSKKIVLNLSLLFAFVGYLIQAFFNIRILLIAPFFFIICGLLVSDDKKWGYV